MITPTNGERSPAPEQQPRPDQELYQELSGQKWLQERLTERNRQELRYSHHSTYIEATNDRIPGRIVRFVLKDMDKEVARQYIGQIAHRFNQSDNLGIMFRAEIGKEGSLFGMITPNKDVDLNTLQLSINDLVAQVNQELKELGGGECWCFISEVPEQQLVVTETTPGKYVTDVPQALGPTFTALARKELDAGKIVLDPGCYMVTSDVIKDALKVQTSSLGQKYPLSPGPKLGKISRRLYLSQVGSRDQSTVSADVLLPYDQPENKPSPHATSERHDNEAEISLNGMPRRATLDRLKPNWQQEYKEKGFVEMSYPGPVAMIKIDVSGLTKLVADRTRAKESETGGRTQLVDPGSLITELLKSLCQDVYSNHPELFHEDTIMKIEGDAFNICLPITNSGADNQQAISMVNAFHDAFPRALKISGSMRENWDITPLGPHEIGLKGVVSMGQGMDLTLLGNGLVMFEQPIEDSVISAAETQAKKNQQNTSLVIPKSDQVNRYVLEQIGHVTEMPDYWLVAMKQTTNHLEEYWLELLREHASRDPNKPPYKVEEAQFLLQLYENYSHRLQQLDFTGDNLLISAARLLAFYEASTVDKEPVMKWFEYGYPETTINWLKELSNGSLDLSPAEQQAFNTAYNAALPAAERAWGELSGNHEVVPN